MAPEQRAGIGAAETEGVDQRVRVVAVERRRAADHVDVQRVERNALVGCVEIDARRNLPAAQHQRGLDQPGDAGRRLEMADVAFHRADAHRAVAARLPEHFADGTGLDRIAQRRAGAVRLHIGDVVGADAGLGGGFLQHRLLRRRVGRGDTVGAAILVDRGRFDHGVDAVAVAQCVVEALEQHHARALATYETIGV